LRKGSPTFLQWHAEVLSPGNMNALLIPRGCAHGFQALTDDVEMLYLHSAAHAPASEGGLSVTDPLLAVEWPLPIGEMSARDRAFPFLSHDFKGIDLS
jgi:dTDP-4-dehydrorhamnose 3,5-epimerase